MKHSFTATKHSTVEDKEKFFKQFCKFVSGGFQRSDFPKWFYGRLSLTFGHIAHYNQDGFYGTFFLGISGKIDFLEQCLAYPCYGSPGFTYCDVEKELQSWLKDGNYLDALKDKMQDMVVSSERAQTGYLKAKYE